MGKSKKNRVNVVYSTNPNFEFEVDSDDETSIPFNLQKLYVSIDRKNRGGKSVTLVEGFIGNDEDAKDLAKKLKQLCGVGGGFKNSEIYIQGDQKNKVASFLQKLGAVVKLKGG
ncbi:MAG: translation initiation factor [Crocinitomicaceae bacterium]|nr:translation initiation factor [Crocinitomicaceae bacterium]